MISPCAAAHYNGLPEFSGYRETSLQGILLENKGTISNTTLTVYIILDGQSQIMKRGSLSRHYTIPI